jgi:Holliday junction resolvase RusA-like endonuclease
MIKKYDIIPVPKPRMSRQDAWLRRPSVTRYWNFKAHCKLLDLKLPEGAFHVHFVLPMPDSWSKKKRSSMALRPHKQKPDIDNLTKAIFDALFEDDCHISDCRTSKWWGEEGCIIIEEISEPVFPMCKK